MIVFLEVSRECDEVAPWSGGSMEKRGSRPHEAGAVASISLKGMGNSNVALSLRLDQPHHLSLRIGVALDIPLRGGEARMARQLLHVPEAPTRLHDLLRGPGDERPPAAVAARPGE